MGCLGKFGAGARPVSRSAPRRRRLYAAGFGLQALARGSGPAAFLCAESGPIALAAPVQARENAVCMSFAGSKGMIRSIVAVVAALAVAAVQAQGFRFSN